MQTIDFTPQWYRTNLQASHDRRKGLGYLGVILLLIVGGGIFNEVRIREARADLTQNEQNHRKAMEMQADLNKLREEKDATAARVRRYDQANSSVPVSIIMAEISHCLPEDVRLSDFTLQRGTEGDEGNRNRHVGSKDPVPAKTSLPDLCDTKVTLKAQATDDAQMATFVRRLSESALFGKIDHKTSTSHPWNQRDIVEKEITLYINNGERFKPS